METANPTPAKEGPALKELPFVRGFPFLGQTLSVLRDPVGWGKRQRALYGDAFAANLLFQKTAVLTGPEALELVLLNKDQSFSTEQAYTRFFGHLTDTSLLMMDFAVHRKHRQGLNPAFKNEVMKGYLAQMNTAIKDSINSWAGGEQFLFYPGMKQLTLDVATSVFLGLPEGKERQIVNAALTDILASAIAVVRLPLPGTRWGRGLKAQRKIQALLRSQIPAHRKADGEDVFSRLCRAVDENGNAFSDDEILGHLITFWIAGHDTLASSLSTLVYHLGKNPEWQDKLADEVAALGLEGRAPTLDDLKALPLCGYAFREALRIMPPAMAVPRGTLKDTSYKGYRIPADMQVSVNIYAVHHDETLWPEPEKFDPMRFAPQGTSPKNGGSENDSPENAAANRNRFAWAPFGGGAHKCIGMVFAETQAKCFLINLLGKHRIKLAKGYEASIKMLPTPRPADGLPLQIL